MNIDSRSLNAAGQTKINGIPVETAGIVNNEILKYDAAQGIFKNQPDSGSGGSNNIYNTNGSLTATRTVTLSGNDLLISGTSSLNLLESTNTAVLAAPTTNIGAAGGTLNFPHLSGSVTNSILVTDNTGNITAAATPTFSAAKVGDGTNTDQDLIEFEKGLADNYDLKYYSALYGDSTLVGLCVDFPQTVGPQQLRCNLLATGNVASYISSFAKDLVNGEGGIEYGTNDLTSFAGGKKMRHYLDSTTNISGLTYRNGASGANTLQFWTLDPSNSTATEYNIASASCTGNVTLLNGGQFLVSSAAGLLVDNGNLQTNNSVLFGSTLQQYIREEGSPGNYAVGSASGGAGTSAYFRVGGFFSADTGLQINKTGSGVQCQMPNLGSFLDAAPNFVLTCDASGNITRSTTAQVAPASTTIYNGDGTLTSGRTIIGSGNSFAITNVGSFTTTSTGLISFTTTNNSLQINSNAGSYSTSSGGISISTAGALPITLNSNGAGVDLSTNKIINMADPTLPQDAATKIYVDTSIQPAGCFIITSPPITQSISTTPNTISGGLTLIKGSSFSLVGSQMRYDGFYNLDFKITVSLTLENATSGGPVLVIGTLLLNGAFVAGGEIRHLIDFDQEVSTSISIIRSLSTNDLLGFDLQTGGGTININVINYTMSVSKV